MELIAPSSGSIAGMQHGSESANGAKVRIQMKGVAPAGLAAADHDICLLIYAADHTANALILTAIEPVDFRKGIDALAQLCKQKLETDPSGLPVPVQHASGGPLSKYWSTTRKVSGSRKSACRKPSDGRKVRKRAAAARSSSKAQGAVPPGHPSVQGARVAAGEITK